MGKGDHRRPLSVDPETFADNWRRAFRKREQDDYATLAEALDGAEDEGQPDGSPNINTEGENND